MSERLFDEHLVRWTLIDDQSYPLASGYLTVKNEGDGRYVATTDTGAATAFADGVGVGVLYQWPMGSALERRNVNLTGCVVYIHPVRAWKDCGVTMVWQSDGVFTMPTPLSEDAPC